MLLRITEAKQDMDRSTRLTLTPGVQEAICKALRKGHYLGQAGNLAGIPYRTMARWLAKGREAEARGEENVYTKFNDAVQEAVSHAEDACLDKIDEAIEHGTWQAAAWKAERRWPERWGRRDPTAIMLAALKNLPTDPARMLDELKNIVGRLQTNYEMANGNPPQLEEKNAGPEAEQVAEKPVG